VRLSVPAYQYLFVHQCYCGTQFVNGATTQPDSNCSVPCTGDSSQACGGSFLLSVFNSSRLTVFAPQAVPSVGPYISIGCWTDTGANRTLSAKTPALGSSTTAETCEAACSGYKYFGLEFGQEVSEIYFSNMVLTRGWCAVLLR
jgi:hypothetical protein